MVALSASALDLEGLVADTLASGTRLPGFKPHTTAFVGYFCAHQAYHHAEIGIVAKELGFPIDKKTAFGMWEWGVR